MYFVQSFDQFFDSLESRPVQAPNSHPYPQESKSAPALTVVDTDDRATDQPNTEQHEVQMEAFVEWFGLFRRFGVLRLYGEDPIRYIWCASVVRHPWRRSIVYIRGDLIAPPRKGWKEIIRYFYDHGINALRYEQVKETKIAHVELDVRRVHEEGIIYGRSVRIARNVKEFLRAKKHI